MDRRMILKLEDKFYPILDVFIYLKFTIKNFFYKFVRSNKYKFLLK